MNPPSQAETESSNPAAAPLLQQLQAGDVRALARAISLVENHSPQSTELLAACHELTAKTAEDVLRIGFTGPPGAGKSTLVDQVARLQRAAGRTVGILAVDPTSPYTGGAILGDRIRMNSHFADPGLYIRSMATRGFLGGLASTAADVCTLMEASGKQSLLIETVGVGQDEVDIVRLADITVLVLVPGMGDDVQSIKAGIMEIADIFVINKSDRDGADLLEREIRSLQSLQAAHGAWVPPIVRTVASTGDGVAQLMVDIERCAEHLRGSGEWKRKRAAAWKARIVESMRQQWMRELSARGLGPDELEAHANAVADRRENPYLLVPRLLATLAPSALRAEGLRIDHLGIAVASIEKSQRLYELLGLRVDAEEVVAAEKVRVAMLALGESRIELLEPTSEDSPVGKFLAKRGEGLHHIALHVANIQATFDRLLGSGVRLVNDKIGIGAGGHAYFFLHPASAGGVLIEICGDPVNHHA